MTRKVLLRKSVTKPVTKEVVVKPDLYAPKCVCCGKVFVMKDTYSGENPGELSGIFDCWNVLDSDGRGMGNMFAATICSFKCAEDVFMGGWKNIEEYKPYVEAEAKLTRGKISINTEVKLEDELIKQWESLNEERGYYVTIRDFQHHQDCDKNINGENPGSETPSFRERLKLAVDIILMKGPGRKYFN